MDKNLDLLELNRSWSTESLPLSPELDINGLLEQTKDARERVFQTIDGMRDEAIAFLQSLIRINSVNPSPGFEHELADYVAEKMRQLSMDVHQIEPEKDRISNLGLYHGYEGHKTLLINSHLDTVPAGTLEDWISPPFEARIVGNRIIGRGAKDCKLGMASSLMALEAIQRSDIHLRGNYMITTTAGEETGGGLGLPQLIDTGLVKADYAIYAEGEPRQLVIGARGFCQIEISVKGKATHSSNKHLGTNAIVKMAPIIKAIDSMAFTNWKPHEVVPGKPVASVNMISGGFKENVVPDSCTIIVDIRFLPGMTIDSVISDVDRVRDSLQRQEPFIGGLDYSVRIRSVGRPMITDANDPFVKVLQRAVFDVTGEMFPAFGMTASTDARWLVNDAKIPTILFSLAESRSHVPNEFVIIEQYIQNIKIYAETALMLLM